MANPRELADQAFTLLRDALRDSEARVAELDAELQRRREPRDAVEQRLQEVEAELSKRSEQADHLEDLLENERAKTQQLRKKLETAEGGPDRLTKKEVNYWRQRVEAFDEEAKEYRARIARLQQKVRERSEADDARPGTTTEAAESPDTTAPANDEALEAAQRESRILREQVDQYHAELETLRAQHAELKQGGSHDDERTAGESARADAAERRLREAEAALEALRGQEAAQRNEQAEWKQGMESSVAQASQRAETAENANRELNATLAEANERLTSKEQQRAELEQYLADARAQIEGLEAELHEEKEVSDNLSELANERRETVTKLQEKVEELEERFAESEWRLGKARHFERLVRRRKGLIRNLIATIRAKHKANTALKAGLDGLRRYKATAEANQQKLLKRIDKLKADLEQTREKLAERTAVTKAEDEVASRVPALEERLATQAEIIESLETELKAEKAARRARDEVSTELTELREALQTKDNVIAELQKDIEDQARRLGKLRGSESETMRLKAISDQDKSQIELLKREVTKLREMLSQKQQSEPGTDMSELVSKLKEHEESIAQLMSTIDEKDAHIQTLTESADEWKRKYEFVSAEEPDAYKSLAHE